MSLLVFPGTYYLLPFKAFLLWAVSVGNVMLVRWGWSYTNEQLQEFGA